MPHTIRRTSRFVASVDRLTGVITSHEFLLARHRLQGAASTRIVDVHAGDGQLVQRAESQEYVHTMTGVDRSRTGPGQTTYTWDLEAHTCRWAWVGTWGARVALRGNLQVRAASEGETELFSETTVEVNVPLLSGLIEKRIASEIEASMPEFEGLVRASLESGKANIAGEGQGTDERNGPKA